MINNSSSRRSANWGHFFRWFLVIAFIGLGLFIYIRYYYVFGRGTKAGVLNTFMLKGYVFKTYEGKIIQSGFQTGVQSIGFDFTVTKESVAQVLLQNAGREVEVSYKEYFAAPFWRGQERFVVDSVYEIRNPNGGGVISPQ